jgi:hypothetical protein
LAILLLSAAVIYFIFGSTTNDLDEETEEEKEKEKEKIEKEMRDIEVFSVWKDENGNFYFPRRFMVLILLFFGSFVTYCQRMNLSITIDQISQEYSLRPGEKSSLMACMLLFLPPSLPSSLLSSSLPLSKFYSLIYFISILFIIYLFNSWIS